MDEEQACHQENARSGADSVVGTCLSVFLGQVRALRAKPAPSQQPPEQLRQLLTQPANGLSPGRG